MRKLQIHLIVIALFITSTIIAQWNLKLSNLNSLNAIHFPTSNVGYAVGNNGIIFKSVDSGETWNSIYFELNNHLNDVHFLNEYVGFAVGGSILKTIDGGISWNIINSQVNDLIKINFITNQIGYLASSNGVYKTLDGGNSWTIKTNIPCRSISFPTEDIGYIHGNVNSLYKTTDGGETWALLNSNINPENVSIVSDLFSN